MNKKDAEVITAEYLPRIFGFALKRCRTPQDAEDLSQDILLRIYKTLLLRDDIADYDRFIWRIAHNMLCNYYRDSAAQYIGISPEEISTEIPADDDDVLGGIIERETADRLRAEIAYLSKTQRRVVIAYYFENKKQNEIADELGIPVGTVKWHLFEAKKDLKKGMETMRTASDLKFNPIRFTSIGISGNPGKNGSSSKLLRSSLEQNILYSVWKEAKSITEIADDLGVSPVYVESEAEYLEEYGFLKKTGVKYLCNILLKEKNEKLTLMEDAMYRKAAELIADELFDEIIGSGIIGKGNIWGGRFGETSLNETSPQDISFLMWALFPYAAALGGEELMDCEISFDEAAEDRPDGGQYICIASVNADGYDERKMPQIMKNWFGPCWSGFDGIYIWQIDSEWSEKRIDDTYVDRAHRILSLMKTWADEDYILSNAEYAFLAENGILSIVGEVNAEFRTTPKCVWIEGKETKRELLEIGGRIKKKHLGELNEIKAELLKAELATIPKHLHKMHLFCRQFTFFSDGMFVWYCLRHLVDSGKLKLPTDEQKKSLSMLIINENED